MTKADMPRFAKAMTFLAQAFRYNLSRADLEIYWNQLREYAIHRIEEAIFNYSRYPDERQSIPTAGKIVSFIEGNSTTQAIQAWTKVLNAIKHKGPYQTVVFDDAIIHVVLQDMGGWTKTCQLLEKDVPFRAREFENRYIGYLMRKPATYPKKLIGIIEAVNSATDYEEATIPLLIGDKNHAYQVYKTGIDGDTYQDFYTPLTVDMIKKLENKEEAQLLEEKEGTYIFTNELFDKNGFSR